MALAAPLVGSAAGGCGVGLAEVLDDFIADVLVFEC